MSEDPEMCADVGKDNDGCLCVLFVGIPELEGAINMDCPIHCPPLGPDDCECGNMRGVHKREVPGCEYHNHHCDLCHDNKFCTTIDCKQLFGKVP